MKLKTLYFFFLFPLVMTNTALAMELFVSIAPQRWLAQEIGGNLVTTQILIGEGQDPHTFEPTPRQMIQLSRAKLYFTLDLEFEAQLVKKLESSAKNLTFIDSAHLVQKIPLAEQHGDHSHQGHQDETDHLDPHIWLSPTNLKAMAQVMAEAMMTSDPTNKASYQDNRDRVIRRLDLLDKRIQKELEPFAGQAFYVFHPSFGYFADAYKLQQKAVETGGKTPRPKQLSQLIAQARKDNVRVIFVQPQFDPKSASMVAQAIDGEVVSLDALAEDVAGNLETMMIKIKSAMSR